jgi:hypothetical protein
MQEEQAETAELPAAENGVADGHATHEAEAGSPYWPAGQGMVLETEPAGHMNPAEQAPLHDADDSPATLPNVPSGHTVHVKAPAMLYWPAGHITTEALVDPKGHLKPAGQTPVQLDVGMDEVLPYLPPGQSEHTAAPTRLYWPAGQVDAVALADPAGHAYPAVQAPLHTEDDRPATSPNLPPEQGMHDAADRLYWPAGQIEVLVVDPEGHAYPAVQTPLHIDDDKPAVPPNLPAGHSVHDDKPAVPPNLPAGHSVHDDAADRLYCPAAHMSAVALVDPAGHE